MADIIGQMRDRVSILRPVEVSDGAGGATAGTATTVISRWSAQVSPLNGRERLESEQVQGQTMFRVRIRRKTGLSTRDYVVWHEGAGDRTLDIMAIVNSDEQRRFLTLDCIERVP